jgi:hypothetical protein
MNVIVAAVTRLRTPRSWPRATRSGLAQPDDRYDHAFHSARLPGVEADRVRRRPFVVSRRVGLLLVAPILGVGVAFLVGGAFMFAAHGGEDLATYLRHTSDWAAGRSFYSPRQLEGPYLLQAGDSLYPPTAALLFLPFLAVPTLLWWAIPAIVVADALRRWRPAPWTWPILTLCLVYPRTLSLIIYGNPSMWITAGVASGLLWGWPAVFVALKPTLAPFALIGCRHRSWWIAGAGLAVLSLLFVPGWIQYAHALQNLRGQEWTYSLGDIPMVILPVVAWVGRFQPTREFDLATDAAGSAM